MSYDPYGNTTVVSGSTLPTEGFAGMYWHQPSGEYLTIWRIYDALRGIWLSHDPEGEGSDTTLYSYVANNPISFVDPTGLYFVLPKDPTEAQQVANALQTLSAADLAYYHSRGEEPGIDSISAMLQRLQGSPYPVTITIDKNHGSGRSSAQ
ncbi:MAG: RHS repeat-associated core domain-containing protein [Verrucomicrobiota bacterium]